MKSIILISFLLLSSVAFSKDYYAFKCINDTATGECNISETGILKMEIADDGMYYGVLGSFGMIANLEQFYIAENINGEYRLSATSGDTGFLAVPTTNGLTGIITGENSSVPQSIPSFKQF